MYGLSEDCRRKTSLRLRVIISQVLEMEESLGCARVYTVEHLHLLVLRLKGGCCSVKP